MDYKGELTLAYRANGGTFDVEWETESDPVDGGLNINWTARDSENGHELVDDDFVDYYGDWIYEQIMEVLNSI